MSSQPFLSIVIPTRDRPHLIKHALWSLQHQTDSDFEVIVCDNPTTKPSRHVFDEFADSRFRYVRPPKPLSMVDNWNFAVTHARGLYITYLEDKFALKLDCVQWAKSLLQKMPAEALNWYHDLFYQGTDADDPDSGTYYEFNSQDLDPVYFDPRAVLGKRLSCDFVRGQEGGMYGTLQILYGVYHEELVKRIIQRTGRLFHPISPDFTSLTAAALLARSALDGGRSGCVGIVSPVSNGIQTSRDPDRLLSFLRSVGDLDELVQSCPLPGVFMSGNNFICRDHMLICDMLPEEAKGLEVNYVKLHGGCPAELKNVQWRSDAERNEQMALIEASLRFFPWKQRAGCRLDQWQQRLDAENSNAVSRSLGPALGWLSQKLQPASMIPTDSELWKRWTHKAGHTELPLAWTLREALTLSEISRPIELKSTRSVDTNNQSQTTMTPHDESELARVSRKLATDNEQLRKDQEQHSATLADLKSEHSAKLTNFREMISRRDARIEKLELKLGIKPKKDRDKH